MKAVFVSQFEPKPVGHGGNHRAYQILHDLEQVVGSGNVVFVSWPQWRKSQPVLSTEGEAEPNSLWEFIRRVGHKVLPPAVIGVWRKLALRQKVQKTRARLPFLFVEHPTDLLAGTGGATRYYSDPSFLGYYRQAIEDIEDLVVCVIEHFNFAGVLRVNSELNIPTVCCAANIESLDTAVLPRSSPGREIYISAIGFADEFSVLARCESRLFISKVEAGLVGGLGLPSHYYPYLPVGEIRQSAEKVRQARERGRVESGLFLMLGSAVHATTRESFLWFVQNAGQYGLPDGVCVIVGGGGTDELLPGGDSIPGLELRGWLEQDELDELLIRTQAVLIPQTFGFGALTRLPELSCAGVPVIVSRHPTFAVDLPPGVKVVQDSWEAWYSEMEKMADQPVQVDWEEYCNWEQEQTSTLTMVVERFLKHWDAYALPNLE